MPKIRAAGSLQTCRAISENVGNKPGPDVRCFPGRRAGQNASDIASVPDILKDNHDNEIGILSLLSNTIIIVRKGKTEKRHYFNSECKFSQASVQEIETKRRRGKAINRKNAETVGIEAILTGICSIPAVYKTYFIVEKSASICALQKKGFRSEK